METAAKTDGYCLNDRQCILGGRYTFCKYIIPRVYGKCRCPLGYISNRDTGHCLPALNKKCESDSDCEAGTSNSFCKLPSFRSFNRESVCACRPGFRMSGNKTSCEPLSGLSSSLSPSSLDRTQTSLVSSPSAAAPVVVSSTPTAVPAVTSSSTQTTATVTTALPTLAPVPVPSLAQQQQQQQPFINTSAATSDLALLSLGKECTRDLECQVRDPYSVCRDGVCDCASPTPKCSAKNTGCHNDTFQCRNGQCISWYFVCDKNRNCDDGSDEEDCGSGSGSLSGPELGSRSCPKEAFRCDDGTCLSRGSVCNGRWECPDGSDEARCYKGVACDNKSFRCKSGQCLPQYTFCNAVTDCIDGSDEEEGVCEHSQVCPKGTFQCANNKCRSTAILCSGVDGCGGQQ